ncbi:hypothetical protein CN448_20025 [Bacillus cereus]|uniref:helix-turn-helix domain-containing protein n=1 Tax=Bacillus cereus TaxID=1396 RepID=UPI000BF7C3FA|nr:helix-turn-helix transcriptional regulator [Bacillus cereus]PEW67205.1 hypothetical protein CN448_20025 [Bacillus cereus]
MTIGQKIKNLREARDWTQQQLADESNISRISIGNYERDSRKPTTDKALQIAHALGVSINRITDNELGDYLKHIREENNLNFEKLNNEGNLSTDLISQIEDGFIPDKETLIMLAKSVSNNEQSFSEIRTHLINKAGYAFYIDEVDQAFENEKMDGNKIKLGGYIRRVRIDKKLSLRQIAELTGISHPYLSQLETGSHKKPSPEILEKIAEGLDINYNYLSYLAGYFRLPAIENNETLTNEEKEEQIKEAIHEIPGNIFDDPFNSSQTIPLTSIVPKFINIADEKDGVENQIPTTHDHLFDLHYLLQMDVDLCYNKQQLTSENKKDILKFIENFIIK